MFIDAVLKTDFESTKLDFTSSKTFSYKELPGICCNRNSNTHFQRGLGEHSFPAFLIFLLLFAGLNTQPLLHYRQRPGAALHVPGLVQKCDTQYIQNSFLTLVIDFSCLNFAHLVESKSSKQTEERMYVSTQQGADP